MPWPPDYNPLHHNLFNLGLCFALAVVLAWWVGRPPKPPRDGKHRR